MSKPHYFLLVRSYPENKFVSVWVCRRFGETGQDALLWGEVLPRAVEELAAATGLPVEHEELPLGCGPMTPPGCVPVEEQPSLFGSG